jgi:hypothetical protein
MSKKSLGQFFTKKYDWLDYDQMLSQLITSQLLEESELDNESKNTFTFVDPFAGDGDLLNACANITRVKGFNTKIIGFDIDQNLCKKHGWTNIDSILTPFSKVLSLFDDPFRRYICVTNPPYLAKNSAKRQGIAINPKHYEFRPKPSNNIYDKPLYFSDMYLTALYKCVSFFNSGLMIVPETVIQYLVNNHEEANSFNGILSFESITVLQDKIFEDTSVPVCVVLWDKTNWHGYNTLHWFGNPELYINDKQLPIKKLETLAKYKYDLLSNRTGIFCKFNDPKGQIGLIAIDSMKSDKRIRFTEIDKFDYDISNVSDKSRTHTVISISKSNGEIYSKEVISQIIEHANYLLDIIRFETSDLLLSPFKCNNNAGIRRRRLDYKLAEALLTKAANEILSYKI